MGRVIAIYFLITNIVLSGEIHLGMNEAVEYALKHNPSLQVVRLGVEEVKGRMYQTGRLTNPELGFEYSRSTTSRENGMSFELLQKFPVTSRLRLQKKIAQSELELAEEEIRRAELEVAGEVKREMIRLLVLKEQEELGGRQRENMEEISQFARGRASSGEISGIDAAVMELESKQIAAALLQFDVERAAVLGKLRVLMGVSPADQIVVTGILPKVAIPSALGGTHHPDIQVAQRKIEMTVAQTALARAERWEDVGVGPVVERELSEDAPEGLGRETFVGFKVSLPLPVWNRNSGRIKEMQALELKAQKQKEVAEISVDARAAESLAVMRAHSKVISEMDERLIPEVKKISEQIRSSYEGGQVSLQEVLRVRNQQLALERQRLDALRDFHLARINYEQASGNIFLK